ncbi:MAG: ANTAR domain-containing protein [Oscillospiraceae bacterium]|nr:ANTAR domain-containing protein [Oscillospiraceae bacterium]
MELKEKVYSVLVVSSSEKFSGVIKRLLPNNMYSPVSTATDVSSAKRQVLERDYDIVMINSPLSDEFGKRFAIDLSQSSGAGVILFAGTEHFPEISEMLMPYGVLTIPKPVSVPLIQQSLLILRGTRERLRRMEKKSPTFEEKMAEIRLVNQAKLLLITKCEMSEPEAHRYIEKRAMDNCVTKKVAAGDIIREYEQNGKEDM